MVTGGNDPPGRVVILNGGSSAGKTTLGRSLQAALSDTWVLLGIDLLIWMMPPRMINDADGLSVHEGVIVRGDLFMSLYAGFRSAVATLAHSGVNVLLDDLTLDGADDQHKWSDALQGLEVLWVGVRCDPAIAAEREARRQSRLPGIACHQAESVHVSVHYDVEVDTGVLGLPESMSRIAESMGRRWSIPVPVLSNRPSMLPLTSPWSPGESVSSAPWER
jgi:chloramphenicol 3-O phosphotransferase